MVIHTAAARKRALVIALIIGLIAIPILVGILFWVGGAGTNCAPAAAWSAWSDCSVPCSSGGGQGQGGWQYRTRPPAVMPANGGAECVLGELLQSQSCNTDIPCGLPCVPNPNGSQYAWSGCPPCVPQGAQEVFEWRIVPPLQEPGPYGAPCPPNSVFQTQVCPAVPPCAANIDCVISTATVASVTACNAPCGPGIQLQWHSITTPQSGSGAGCDWNLLVQEVACDAGPCPTTVSCDGVTSWSPWSACDVACGQGWQYATRPPASGLDHCPLLRSQTCAGLLPACQGTATANCCVTGPSCAPPTWEYLETLCYMQCAGMPLPSIPLDDNGVPFCDVTADMLNAACGVQQGCVEPLDCQLSPWSAWSSCSVLGCDADFPQGGEAVASRNITAYAQGGGQPCSAFPTVLSYPCNNLQPVPYMSLSADGTLVAATAPPTCVPVNCTLSDWFPVSGCSAACGQGWQMLAKSVTTPAAGGGTCDVNPGDYVSSQTCDSGVTCGGCTWQPWSDYFATCSTAAGSCWSECDAACDGLKTATRALLAPPPPGGWCSLSDATTVTACCEGCSCQDVCPVGSGGLVCSGRGTCASVTSGGGAWSYSCACDAGWSGYACGQRCPEGPTGLSCNGHGTCGADATCACDAGWFGDACQQSGSCVIMGETTVNGVPLRAPLACVAITPDFTRDHCVALSVLPTVASPPMLTLTPGFMNQGPTATYTSQEPMALSGVPVFDACPVIQDNAGAMFTADCPLDAGLAAWIAAQVPAAFPQFGTPTLTTAAYMGFQPFAHVNLPVSGPQLTQCATFDNPAQWFGNGCLAYPYTCVA